MRVRAMFSRMSKEIKMEDACARAYVLNTSLIRIKEIVCENGNTVVVVECGYSSIGREKKNDVSVLACTKERERERMKERMSFV